MNTDRIVLVEGERDAIKLLQEGIATVSTHGAKLTMEQMEIILSLNPKEIYLAFDGDEAGRSATKKSLKMLEGKVNYVIPMDIPLGKDPKKFNGEEFLEFMNSEKRRVSFQDSPFEK
jgi:DNA primase